MSDLTKVIKVVKGTNKILAKQFHTFGMDTLKLKGNKEIVTRADMVTNEFITKKLLKYFPDDDIISEEAKKIDNPGKNTWYIDPLDGTTNFSYGLREFATCLARITPQKIDIGVIGIPLAQEIYWVQNGGSAYLNGKKITVSSTHNDQATRRLIFICDGHSVESKKRFVGILEKIDIKDFRIRVFSSAGIELTAVACGRADGCILPETHPWDVLAGVQLVRAAGGKATNFNGEEWSLKDTNLIASNSLVHNKILDLVK